MRELTSVSFIVPCLNEEPNIEATIEAIRGAGRSAGLALRLETPVAAVQPYVSRIECLLLLGTEPGVKGCDLAPQACARLAEARRMLAGGSARVLLVADGGVRRHTVPLLRRAGADVVVPGSLVFQAENIEDTFRWLHAV